MLRHAARVLLFTVVLGVLVAAMDPGGPSDAAPAIRGGAPVPSSTAHTTRAVVRPVSDTGTPVADYTVHRESGTISCDDQATTAVSRGIDVCFPSAYYAPSCWKSTDHTALCLRDVSRLKLVRIRYSGRFAAHRPVRHQSPQALKLANGATCAIRVGGAWGDAPGHPGWLGNYSCTNGSVYGPPDGDGIDRSRAVWRVHVLRADGTMAVRKVKRATYVGTAS